MPSRKGKPAPPAWWRRARWVLALAVAALVALVVWQARDGAQAGAARPAASAPAASGPRFFGRIATGPALPDAALRGARLRELTENFKLADHSYCSYREGSKYPPSSRPISEQPDQVYPNQLVTEAHDMRTEGGGSDPKVQLQTSQSRVFMAAGEAVAFSLRAIDGEGRVLPLAITRAVAQGITFKGARQAAQVALAFADDGRGADPVAGDGAYAAVLAPAQTGLAAFNGTIRTEVHYSVEGRSGFVLFDVIYSPEVPAVWSGQVREAVENGSLNFYLKAEIRQPGRYIVTGRVDDAKGHPFALATFNDVLAAGPNEIRLTLFGKLMRDQEAALPLTLRDVDGHLLKENTDPDRALMARLEGKVYASKAYPLKNFSDAEWQSEERARYLAEFGKDLAAAGAALKEYDPAQDPKSACVSN